jgi:hypothetical protein
MQVTKSLQASLLTHIFSIHHGYYFIASTIWGFRLDTGEPVLEQTLWSEIGQAIGQSTLFDEAINKDVAEFIVIGDAFSPNGKMVARLEVDVSLADSHKRLNVTGDRYWQGNGAMLHASTPTLFNQKTLDYTNAFGGEKHRFNKQGKGSNPVDVGEMKFHWLPNIECPNNPVTGKSHQADPAGFAPVNRQWPQRAALAGTYDDHYLQNDMPGLASDINWQYFNVAPKDQQLDGYLHGDETFSITNMHKTMPLIKGKLPSVVGRCFIEQEKTVPDGALITEFKEIPLNLDTVVFLPNANLGMVIHRGTVEVSHPQGRDIKKLLIAHQGLNDNKKDKDFYHNEMTLRSDPDEAFKYLMYSAPLIPEGVTCGFKGLLGDTEYEQAMADNMTAYAERKKTDAQQQADEMIDKQIIELKAIGKEKEALELKARLNQNYDTDDLPDDAKKMQAIAEKILPGCSDGKTKPQDLDLTKLNLKALDEMQAVMQDSADKQKKQALKQLNEQLVQLKKTAAYAQGGPEAIRQLEKMIEDFTLPPILPRPLVKDQIDNLNKQFEQTRELIDKSKTDAANAGIILTGEQLNQIEALEKQLNDNSVMENLKKAHEFAVDSYLKGAHFIPEARSPHAGKEPELVAALLAAYIAGKAISKKDFAFCELSQQQFSATDLENGFFEYSQLSQVEFNHSNLTAINFAHAKLTNVTFDHCKIKGANLGAGQLEYCHFIGLSLDEITLAKSTLSHCEFIDCDFGDRMDMLLEATFSDCNFIRCKLMKLNWNYRAVNLINVISLKVTL